MDVMERVVINDSWTLLLPAHRAKQWAGGWERERLAAMNACIQPGDVVYDVGAEEGDMPALWASWGADVVLIEPDPRVWPNMRAIFEANDLRARLRGWYVGFAGDEERECPEWTAVYANPESDAWPTCAQGPIIDDHGFLVIPERPDCPVITVDTLAKIYGAPTVITVDVEGAEASVLRGAKQVLTEDRPRVFVSEHIDYRWLAEKFPGDTSEFMRGYMTGLGYHPHHLATDHERHVMWVHPDGR